MALHEVAAAAVVKEEEALTESPEWRCAELVCTRTTSSKP